MQAENVHSERELLLQVVAGNTGAFRELYDQYYTRLCFFAHGITGDLSESEDLVQEVFIRLWKRREELAPVNYIKTYLYTAVRNAVFDYLKHRKRISANLEQLGQATELPAPPEEAAVVREEVLQRVIGELESLPEKYRTVLKLLYIEGKTYREISDALQIPEATIRKQKERAVALLQSVLLKNQLSASLVYSPYFIYLLRFVTKS